MGGFTAAKPANPLRAVRSPGPSRPLSHAPLGVRLTNTPQLLVNLHGHCVYASGSLATLLQCGLHELYGDGWRVRISPYADRPFSVERAIQHATTHEPVRLASPDGRHVLVSRITLVSDPADLTTVSGFFARVQLVRVHRAADVASRTGT